MFSVCVCVCVVRPIARTFAMKFDIQTWGKNSTHCVCVYRKPSTFFWRQDDLKLVIKDSDVFNPFDQSLATLGVGESTTGEKGRREMNGWLLINLCPIAMTGTINFGVILSLIIFYCLGVLVQSCLAFLLCRGDEEEEENTKRKICIASDRKRRKWYWSWSENGKNFTA